MKLRDEFIPNYYHVNNDRDILYFEKGKGGLNPFGRDFIDVAGDWQKLCPLDSDMDGASNGVELGDPCCRWKRAPPHTSFSFDKQMEYRRWMLTYPGDNVSSWIDGIYPSPADCSDYSPLRYTSQYHWFYFEGVRGFEKAEGPQLKHYVGIVTVCVLLAYWTKYEGLFGDLFPWCVHAPRVSLTTCILVNLTAFLWSDMTSGIAHLCLDYMPQWTPVVGVIAKGFQEHHRMPSLLAQKRIWNQVNDVFVIMPLPIAFILGTRPTRMSRLFWFWSIAYTLLFLLAHPWAHMYKDMLPWPVQVAQSWGILLDQESHMRHHEDLEGQFTILSGYTDLIIDNLTKIVPPHRYDLWVFFFATWLLLPIIVDVTWRDLFNKLQLRSEPAVTKKTSLSAV